VVEHEGQLGVGSHDLYGCGQLWRQHEQVVDETGGAHRGETPADVLAQQPGEVGLVLHLVTNADEAITTRPRTQSGDLIRHRGVGEVDPTHHTGHGRRRVGGDCEELLGLRDVTNGLHQDGRVDAGRGRAPR
jgi:hypothetical protein